MTLIYHFDLLGNNKISYFAKSSPSLSLLPYHLLSLSQSSLSTPSLDFPPFLSLFLRVKFLLYSKLRICLFVNEKQIKIFYISRNNFCSVRVQKPPTTHSCMVYNCPMSTQINFQQSNVQNGNTVYLYIYIYWI